MDSTKIFISYRINIFIALMGVTLNVDRCDIIQLKIYYKLKKKLFIICMDINDYKNVKLLTLI